MNLVRFTSKFLANEIINDSFYKKPYYVLSRDKNNDFASKYSLSKDEIGNILYSIRQDHFKEKIENEDRKIQTKWLYHFNLLYQLTDEYGCKDMVSIYLKICEIHNSILIVSIHD